MRNQVEVAAKVPVALITITVMLGTIMAIIDTTIVNVALNNIAGNLGATIDDVAWVSTGYILSSVIIMPLNGWLTAFFGRKTFYAGCLAVFTVASLLCGTAHSIWQLVFYRVLQGVGGGALQPTAMAILFETYPREKQGSAMAIFGLGVMVGPAIGPTLGGYIVDNWSWPLIFFINIPIGIAAFLMTLAFIPNPAFLAKPKGGLDWVGLGLLCAGLASLQYVLERGQTEDWWSSNTITTLSIVAVVSLTVLIWKLLRDSNPLVDLRIFRFRTFSVANVLTVIMGFGLFGTNLIMPLFFQNIMGMTAYGTGMALLPGAIATAVAMPIVPRLMQLLDTRWIVAAGFLVFGWSCWWLGGLNQNADYWSVFYPRIVQGFGLGLLFVPLTTVMMWPVPRPEIAGATGVSNLIRQLGGSFGIAILTTLLARQTAVAWSALASGVTSTQGYSPGVLTGMVAQGASVIAYDYLFQICAIVFFVSAPLVFLLRPSRSASGVPATAMAD